MKPNGDHCGRFRSCDVDIPLSDTVWTADIGPFPFVFINGPDVNDYCGVTADDPIKRSLNARIEVQCSQLMTTCQSFEYVWSCFHGLGDCQNAGYDGNGRIKLDDGTYSLNESILVSNQQIIIDGSGPQQTTLIHLSDDNDTIANALIDCYFHQCYLTISNLTYHTKEASVIYVSNGGHLVFDSVYFQNDAAKLFCIAMTGLLHGTATTAKSS